MASTNSPEIRRTTRSKKPSLKALESIYTKKLKNCGLVADISSDEEDIRIDEDEFPYIDPEKPKFLHNNEHVHGEEIFTFQKRKQKDSLALKVAEVQSTPYVVRHKIKNKIAAKLLQEDSGSEYEISSSEENSENEESTDNSETNVLDSDMKHRQIKRKFVARSLQTPNSKVKEHSSSYIIKTDDYFSNAPSNKIKTSDNTLDKLETPRLPQYELQKLLVNMKLSKDHETAVHHLYDSNKTCFEKWLYLLNNGFNILLYGLGTKRNILKSFHVECLKELPVIVINGFFPTLSVKNILDGIIVELLEFPESPTNINEACDLIAQEFSELLDAHLYIIIHNIDGEMLRNSKAQNVLARLAAVENIHLIASLDHINAPLIWDHKKLSKFNYIWWDVTSFLQYIEETSFEKSMMVQQTGSLALSSLRNVFLSLTTNSKSIYLKIAKYQIENAGPYYQGMAFKDLYMSCRESFIVSSDLALRAQLTEFVDHKMVKLKRSADGTEYLVIPILNAVLQKFLEEHL